jgi:hypothetical protein
VLSSPAFSRSVSRFFDAYFAEKASSRRSPFPMNVVYVPGDDMMRYELSDRKLSAVSHVRELNEFGQLGRPSKLVRQSAVMHAC